MTAKDTIEGYFSSLKQNKDWPSFLSHGMVRARHLTSASIARLFPSDAERETHALR